MNNASSYSNDYEFQLNIRFFYILFSSYYIFFKLLTTKDRITYLLLDLLFQMTIK